MRGLGVGRSLLIVGLARMTGGLKRAWEELRKVVRDHVMGSVWDLLQV